MNLEILQQNPELAKNVTFRITGKELLDGLSAIAEKKFTGNEASVEEDEFIPRPEAKAILGVSSDATMIKYEKLGILRSYKLAGKIKYKKSEVRASLKSLSR